MDCSYELQIIFGNLLSFDSMILDIGFTLNGFWDGLLAYYENKFHALVNLFQLRV
jgi:hypothetical protein